MVLRLELPFYIVLGHRTLHVYHSLLLSHWNDFYIQSSFNRCEGNLEVTTNNGALGQNLKSQGPCILSGRRYTHDTPESFVITAGCVTLPVSWHPSVIIYCMNARWSPHVALIIFEGSSLEGAAAKRHKLLMIMKTWHSRWYYLKIGTLALVASKWLSLFLF